MDTLVLQTHLEYSNSHEFQDRNDEFLNWLQEQNHSMQLVNFWEDENEPSFGTRLANQDCYNNCEAEVFNSQTDAKPELSWVQRPTNESKLEEYYENDLDEVIDTFAEHQLRSVEMFIKSYKSGKLYDNLAPWTNSQKYQSNVVSRTPVESLSHDEEQGLPELRAFSKDINSAAEINFEFSMKNSEYNKEIFHVESRRGQISTAEKIEEEIQKSHDEIKAHQKDKLWAPEDLTLSKTNSGRSLRDRTHARKSVNQKIVHKVKTCSRQLRKIWKRKKEAPASKREHKNLIASKKKQSKAVTCKASRSQTSSESQIATEARVKSSKDLSQRKDVVNKTLLRSLKRYFSNLFKDNVEDYLLSKRWEIGQMKEKNGKPMTVSSVRTFIEIMISPVMSK